MTTYLIKRLIEALVALALVSLLVFVGIYAIGDPVNLLLSSDAGPAAEAALRAQLGLDRSLPEQYLAFLGNALRGDLGVSFYFREPAIEVIFERLPATLELAAVAMMFAILIGIPLGLIAGMNPGTMLDRGIVTGSIMGFSLPTFLVGLLLIMVFAVWLGWLPSGGRGDVGSFLGVRSSLFTADGWSHVLMPALNLSIFPMAFLIRLTRSGMREAMSLDFVRFARAQGFSRGRVVRLHVLKYISIPIVTMIGLQFGILIAFAVVTESIFAWPGMGRLIINAINQLDRPLIVAYMLVTSVLFIAINLIVDLVYGWLDPRAQLK
ncbi:ABC transporter permease [Roseovarius nanhaiticus]|uniref:ABC transporter permease n=1 Tax=Roseovarius nanhaiticus TaxID=573024 RepID=UPI002492305A|nr:ABC transporter permease [Roseovarius nanhaiticus]